MGNKKIIYAEEAEIILAEVIDDLYINMKEGFVNYKDKTHKLGFFKELVKANFNAKLAGKENEIIYANNNKTI